MRRTPDDDQINRCPAGHVHLNYDNFTVRFQPDEFLTFARMVAEAAARMQGWFVRFLAAHRLIDVTAQSQGRVSVY